MFNLSEKGRGIRAMFDDIAPRYDLLNRILSFGIDRRWRRYAVGQLDIPPQGKVLDIASGTGDVALEIASRTPDSVQIVGEDLTRGMLVHAQRKIAASPYARRIHLVNAPCEAIPHPDNTFDGITIAFGIRNVVEREAGLREMCRVLKPGGRAVVLEFSQPNSRIFGAVYDFYFNRILPFVAGLLSTRSAYRYLPDSVAVFPPREEFKAMLEHAGFNNVRYRDLTFGIATVYVATCPQAE
jgi:demethylmenaquinone methyltransferase/2-methoxy-6-polyprenyl-1,4-benzoquinol methylase